MGTDVVLLELDYPGRREEARIADLALESRGFSVRGLLGPPFVRDLTAAAYADRLVARHGPFGDVDAVLAYCMAAPIAQEVAARVSAGRDPVTMILFDGEPATPAAVADQYLTTVEQVAEQFGTSAVANSAESVDPAALSARPAETLEWMRGNLVRLAAGALADDCDDGGGGGDDDDALETAEALAEFYLDWLAHLIAAHNASWPAWGGDVYHIVSSEHAFVGNWPGARATTLFRCEVARRDLLSRPEVADLVASCLRKDER
jgi:hypothetical protein